MKTIATVLAGALLGSSVMAQTAADVHRQEAADARELLTHDQLSRAEISQVLTASHGAMYNRVFRVTALEPPGLQSENDGVEVFTEIQMGLHGRPRYEHRKDDRWRTEDFVDYTGQRSYSCGGVLLTGELYIAYLQERGFNPVDPVIPPDDGYVRDSAGGWIKVVAEARDSEHPLEEEFEMYTHEVPLRVGPLATIDGHTARAFITHHEQRLYDRLSSGAFSFPPEVEDWLWIDVQSLLLLRWEERRAGVSLDLGTMFTEVPNRQLHPPLLPKGLTLPTCLTWTKPR